MLARKAEKKKEKADQGGANNSGGMQRRGEAGSCSRGKLKRTEQKRGRGARGKRAASGGRDDNSVEGDNLGN